MDRYKVIDDRLRNALAELSAYEQRIHQTRTSTLGLRDLIAAQRNRVVSLLVTAREDLKGSSCAFCGYPCRGVVQSAPRETESRPLSGKSDQIASAGSTVCPWLR